MAKLELLVAACAAFALGCSDKLPPVDAVTADEINRMSFNYRESCIIYSSVDWDKKEARFLRKTMKGYEQFAMPLGNKTSYFELSVSDPKADRKVYVSFDISARKVEWHNQKKQGADYRVIE